MKKCYLLLFSSAILLSACTNNPRYIADQVMKDRINGNTRYLKNLRSHLAVHVYAQSNRLFDYSNDTDRDFYNSLFDLPQNIKSYDYLELWDNPDNTMFKLIDISENSYENSSYYKDIYENYETYKSKLIELYSTSANFEYIEDKEFIKYEVASPEKRFYYLVEDTRGRVYVTICMYKSHYSDKWVVGAIFKEKATYPFFRQPHTVLYEKQSSEYIEKNSRPWSISKSNESIMTSVKGTFSNSATKDSPLWVEMVLKKNSVNKLVYVYLYLYEYSTSHPVNRSAEKPRYDFSLYINNGITKEHLCYKINPRSTVRVSDATHSEGIRLAANLAEGVVAALKNATREVYFYITMGSSSTYHFYIDTCGFSEAYDYLSRVDN
jgi:hypothetical protein